ncbi:hypothetical protein [Actinomadura oligospora]|uniref:hypothetical protein n=1 Tax=Actinomadura oligospora TaxID=111804 RepID=UPI00047EBEF9|nr:hypothetical protein [Actinomadura oligospora]
MRVRRRFALAVGAVATVVAVAIGWPGGQRSAEALGISRDGRYVDVVVRDPGADPARLQAELDARHLPVRLEAWPASPSLVGAMLSANAPGEGWDLDEHVVPQAEVKGTWYVTFAPSGHTPGSVQLVVSEQDMGERRG